MWKIVSIKPSKTTRSENDSYKLSKKLTVKKCEAYFPSSTLTMGGWEPS